MVGARCNFPRSGGSACCLTLWLDYRLLCPRCLPQLRAKVNQGAFHQPRCRRALRDLFWSEKVRHDQSGHAPTKATVVAALASTREIHHTSWRRGPRGLLTASARKQLEKILGLVCFLGSAEKNAFC